MVDYKNESPQQFCDMKDVLWKSYAPETILCKLGCIQLADSLRTWYIFRDKICTKEFGNEFLYLSQYQIIWFNRNIRSKSKHFFYYKDWFEKGVIYIRDLFNPQHPGNYLRS